MYTRNKNLKRLAIIALILTLSVIFVASAAAETIVRVDAPKYVLSDTFDVKIMIKDVYELDTGAFHLLFDPNVVDVTDVTAGDIGDMNIGFANKRSDKIQGIGIIKVIFDISGTSGVSGSGSLATIGFDVTGSDETCSILNISNPNTLYNPITGFYEGELWNGEAEAIFAKWENGQVCIGDPADTPKARVTVFVKNLDDDSLDVELYIDGEFKKYKKVLRDKTEEFGSFRMDEGVHTFTIRWFDTDTGELYEKIEEHNLTGATPIMLRTDEHGEGGDRVSTHVYVKNLDDDKLDAYLYIDESFKGFSRISSDYTREFGRYKLIEGMHTFRVEWYDPDTGKEHRAIEECLITGDAVPVTIYLEKHDKIDTHVYVTNLDDDKLGVYLYIDGFFKDFEDRVSPGRTREFCGYQQELPCMPAVPAVSPGYTREFYGSDGYKLTDGMHTFRIEWYDPDTGKEHQTTRECLITRDVAITLYTERLDGVGCATVNVAVNAPEFVSETFNVTIDVNEVTNLCGAQFDLTFDPDVIAVGGVESGMIDDREMPITYRRVEDGRLMMMIFDFDLIEEGGVSGSGYLAKIAFDVVGDAGDTNAIDFCGSDEFMRKLMDVDGGMIDANWFGSDVTIGTAT